MLIVFEQYPNHWLLYFVSQYHEKVLQERLVSFDHILCSYILYLIHSTLTSVDLPHIFKSNTLL